jgi:uncharacterized protein (TIGR00369 family)
MNTFRPANPNYEEKVKQSFHKQAFMAFMGAQLVDVRPGFCEIHVPYRKELSQQHGYFHAGVIGTLADNSGGYAAFSLLPPDSSILTVEYKLNLLSPGNGDLLMARGHVVKSGATLTVCRPEVFVVRGGVQRLCATALMTLISLPGRPDGPQ